MKIVSFESNNGQHRIGIVGAGDEAAVDATDQFGSLRNILEKDQLVAVAEWASGRTPDVDLSTVKFLSPVPDARRVICIGVNFEKIHPVHGVMPQPEHVSLFSKFEGSLVGHKHSLLRPANTDSFDYEGEITLVIGKRASRIKAADAASVIAGVTIMNDGSVREWQKHSVGAGKNFQSASSIGPWMATLDEVGDLDDIHLTTWLNGEKVQDVKAHEMVYNIRALIAYVSDFTTLEPGDILSTGSPERVKLKDRPSQYLQVGDQVDVVIEGLGTLSNHVTDRGW